MPQNRKTQVHIQTAEDYDKFLNKHFNKFKTHLATEKEEYQEKIKESQKNIDRMNKAIQNTQDAIEAITQQAKSSEKAIRFFMRRIGKDRNDPSTTTIDTSAKKAVNTVHSAIKRNVAHIEKRIDHLTRSMAGFFKKHVSTTPSKKGDNFAVRKTIGKKP
jgi:predicted  nucleic acid-binding Zn-ribbon protein